MWRWNDKGPLLAIVSILLSSLALISGCTAQTPIPTPTHPATTPTAINETTNNHIGVCFETRWEYQSLEDTFTNKEVSGSKHWFTMMSNEKDETEAAVTEIILTLESEQQFDWSDKENRIKTGPPIYEWAFGNVPQVADLPQETTKVHVGFDRPGPLPVTFRPGFDASRKADKTEFSEPGIQVLTITLTPRVETEQFTIWVSAWENNLVNAVIVSPTSDEEQGIWLDPDGRWLDIWPTDLQLGTTWTVTVKIEVTPKVPNVEFMPSVNIHCLDEVTSGTDMGSSISHLAGEPEEKLGTWTWKADGSYVWNWGETICRMVAFAILD